MRNYVGGEEWLFRGASVADGTRPNIANTWGTSVTPAQDAYGAAYANLGVISSAYDIYEWSISAFNIGVAGASRIGMIKLGMDLAGGTNFTDFLTDLMVGPATGASITGYEFLTGFRFRKRIPAGASIGVKGAVHSATLTAFRSWLYDAVGRPRRPEFARTHEYIDTFGATIANCQGVTVTPGTTNDGSWFEIGTITRRLGWFEYSLALDDSTMTASALYTDIALGDATNKRVIISNHSTNVSANEIMWRGGTAGVPAIGNAGDKIYARVQNSTALDNGTYTIAVYGCGG